MSETKIQYQFEEGHFRNSEPNKFLEENLGRDEMILNLGPQHPSTHGVLRLELLTEGEIVKEVVPHLSLIHI